MCVCVCGGGGVNLIGPIVYSASRRFASLPLEVLLKPDTDVDGEQNLDIQCQIWEKNHE